MRIPAAAPAPAAVERQPGRRLAFAPAVRSFMEPRFGANFGNVRIHTGEAAAQQSASLNAHAFTVGEHVFFGRDQFQPESACGRELIAHELTHTIQQGVAVQRSAGHHGLAAHAAAGSAPRHQRCARLFRRQGQLIPGFRLLTIVLGFNPINMAPVERSAANILRGADRTDPGAVPDHAGARHHGIFDKVGAWVDGQIRCLGMVSAAR